MFKLLNVQSIFIKLPLFFGDEKSLLSESKISNSFSVFFFNKSIKFFSSSSNTVVVVSLLSFFLLIFLDFIKV